MIIKFTFIRRNKSVRQERANLIRASKLYLHQSGLRQLFGSKTSNVTKIHMNSFKEGDRIVHLYHGGHGIVVASKVDEQREEIWYRVLFDGEKFLRAVPEDYLRSESLQ
ncbi:MAG TPA: hypothetical protein VNX68_19660 [Nitrosopumilaceae archaeon]|jgi:hypothetical protein|nr:hypothetical protein [Nitrosopumilaceae archaeon]